MQEPNKTRKKNPKDRSPGNTLIAFSLTEQEREAARKYAEREGRTLSSFLRVILKEGIRRRQMEAASSSSGESPA